MDTTSAFLRSTPQGNTKTATYSSNFKATEKLRVDPTTREIKFGISKRDVLTWESEPFPAYLVVFDAAQRKSYSIYLQQYFAIAGISSTAMTSASIDVRLPQKEVDETTIQGWRADKNAILTQMGAVTHV
jgi:hypothetical protein